MIVVTLISTQGIALAATDWNSEVVGVGGGGEGIFEHLADEDGGKVSNWHFGDEAELPTPILTVSLSDSLHDSSTHPFVTAF